MTGFVVRKPAPPVPEVVDWRQLRRCDKRPQQWELVASKLTKTNVKAVEICGLCPVKQECYTEALRMHDRGVIRGGQPFWDTHKRVGA